uniref:Uncharacterized protein n=1 Tax=Octactis speculum TaxID=3111310 RepID=A0A7S2CW72_9STRA
MEGGFPETKELKQRLRDMIAPDRDLGHSDVGGSSSSSLDDCENCPQGEGVEGISSEAGNPQSPHLSLSFCTERKWLSRAAWMAEEVFLAFPEEVNAVTLAPSRPPAPVGLFTVSLDQSILWDRDSEGSHLDAEDLQIMIRDVVAPQKTLERIDDIKKWEADEIDDEDAAEMRSFFGVM